MESTLVCVEFPQFEHNQVLEITLFNFLQDACPPLTTRHPTTPPPLPPHHEAPCFEVNVNYVSEAFIATGVSDVLCPIHNSHVPYAYIIPRPHHPRACRLMYM